MKSFDGCWDGSPCADGGGVGGVDINIICSAVVNGELDGNGGDDEGDGGCGSINVRNARFIRSVEQA